MQVYQVLHCLLKKFQANHGLSMPPIAELFSLLQYSVTTPSIAIGPILLLNSGMLDRGFAIG